MDIIFVILLIFIFVFFYFYHYNQLNPNSNSNTYNMANENFEAECWTFGDDYNSCYANSNCTVGFLPDGSTHCMKKFLNEDI